MPSETKRASKQEEISDILEIGINPGGKLQIGDLGLIPSQPYQTSKRKIVKTILDFYKRISSHERCGSYLVPMGQQEFYEYKRWKDAK
jgi:hypothetical protein